MVTDQPVSAELGRPDSNAPDHPFDRAQVIRSACLERCDTMARGSYDWGPALATGDRVLTVIVALVFLAIMYLGALI